MEKRIYLVPYDFTPTADGAVTVAVNMAHHSPEETMVELLHFVKKEKEAAAAEEKLKEVVAKMPDPGNTEIKTVVAVGNYIEDIGKLAKETHAHYVVMGTHGMTGLQKVFGMDALKVITHSSTPFIVVQDYVDAGEQFGKIVLPLNLAKESLQASRFTADLAREFGSQVLIVAHREKDQWLRKKTNINVKQCMAFLSKEGVDHEVKIIDEDGAFEKQVVRHAMANRADLIAIAYFHEGVLPQFDTFAQKILTNRANIPVLAVNATELYRTTGSFWTQ